MCFKEREGGEVCLAIPRWSHNMSRWEAVRTPTKCFSTFSSLPAPGYLLPVLCLPVTPAGETPEKWDPETAVGIGE